MIGNFQTYRMACIIVLAIVMHSLYLVDILCGQPINLVQVASTSELRENQQNGLVFFEIIFSHFCSASELQT